MADSIPCPYCGFLCDADFVDIGVGWQQCGPYHCEKCGASQIGGYDEPRELTKEEKETGWYNPGFAPGSSANVINGKVVSADEMKAAYYNEYVNNPLSEDTKYVNDWYKKLGINRQ